MHRGEEKTEAEKAAEETRKARRDPYRVGAHSTKRAEYDGERATDPIHLGSSRWLTQLPKGEGWG